MSYFQFERSAPSKETQKYHIQICACDMTLALKMTRLIPNQLNKLQKLSTLPKLLYNISPPNREKEEHTKWNMSGVANFSQDAIVANKVFF